MASLSSYSAAELHTLLDKYVDDYRHLLSEDNAEDELIRCKTAIQALIFEEESRNTYEKLPYANAKQVTRSERQQ